MSDTKISPCPMPGCGGECFNGKDVFPVCKRYYVYCPNCTYHSKYCEFPEEALAAHKKLCERNQLGKLAEALKKNLPNTDNDYSCPHGFDLPSIKQGYLLGVKACLDALEVKEE